MKEALVKKVKLSSADIAVAVGSAAIELRLKVGLMADCSHDITCFIAMSQQPFKGT